MEAPDGDWVSDRATLADASVACSRWLSNLRGKQRRRNSRTPCCRITAYMMWKKRPGRGWVGFADHPSPGGPGHLPLPRVRGHSYPSGLMSRCDCDHKTDLVSRLARSTPPRLAKPGPCRYLVTLRDRGLWIT